MSAKMDFNIRGHIKMNLKLKEEMIKLKESGACVTCFNKVCVCEEIRARKVRSTSLNGAPASKEVLLVPSRALCKSESDVVLNIKEGK